MELITLKEISKSYRLGELSVPVLKNVSLSVGQGEFVVLMGSSGSGKSTLMNILGALDRPTSGEYWLQGREVSKISSDQRAELRNQQIGFVFQSFNLLHRTSALENVAMPLSYSPARISEREARRRAAEMLQRVGLGERLEHMPAQLSGGQQQRVAIARALINRPSILFADEPTGNLDSQTSKEVLRMFEQLNREEGITIILVTHDPEVAKAARRVIEIKDGVVVGGSEAQSSASAPLPKASEGRKASEGGDHE